MIAGSRLQAVVLYFSFSLVDYWYTSVASRYGVAEASPLFSWALSHHMFFPAKISIALFASILMYVLYNKFRRVPLIAWSAVYIMAVVLIYHVYWLGFLAYHYPHYFHYRI